MIPCQRSRGSHLHGGGLGEKADTAFFKFCNVDINSKTDAKGCSAEYQNLSLLEGQIPEDSICAYDLTGLGSFKQELKLRLRKILGKAY